MFFVPLFMCENAGNKRRYFVRGEGVLRSLSEHDFRDLKDGQDGIVSCPSFNFLNRVQDDG